ncbi:hypothetical protein PBAL39_20174 [Pedobacter sp. BAL39]|uniref:hypothetical protein n=1 Tax=Pedobacter sp. BAL39 TaxID=391596 RepID=UPI0001559930|nr:hypothetical protein [Pedobacter sp. BAL39]EDM36236.1 hypothetical protein PBAL39_20174 [Pedobacter sp. BAL39]
MEFKELENQWKEMSGKIDNQKKLADSKIIKMTEINYTNKINKMKFPEITGAVVCCVALFFIVSGMHKLEPWYLMMCGIVSAIMLILMPVISIRAVFKIQSFDVSTNNYKQTLSAYNKNKMHFINVQKLSMCLGALLFVTILPVIGKLMSGKDLFKSTFIWYIYSVGFPFLYYFDHWVFKKYNSALSKAEDIIRKLED